MTTVKDRAQIQRGDGKGCNCKNSRCLKLYCECFAAGALCASARCRCANCMNTVEHAGERTAAIETVLDRNPNAFRPKIAAVASPSRDVALRHNRGCHCKRSGCLKKYCECFQAAIYCAETCRCVSCENYEGSDAHEEVKRVYGSGARFHDHASAAASPSPSRRKLLAQRAARDSIDGASNRGGGGGGGVNSSSNSDRSPGRQRSEDDAGGGRQGGGLARARAPPLMHNLVQQGAVEELARILLVVADETSKCAVSSETKGEEKVKEEEKPAPTSTRRSSGGVAELAAEAAREIARDVAHVDELMCDEDIDARKARAAHARARDDVSIALDSTLTKYPEIEAALLGELERVARRIAENARARATEAKKRRLANTAAKSSAV